MIRFIDVMKDRFGDIIAQHRQRLGECIASVANDPRSLDRLVTGDNSASVDLDRSNAMSASRSMETSWPGSVGGPMMTPTPSPKPHLGSGLTNSFPAMSNIAPKNPSRQQPASGTGPLGGQFQEEITSSEWSVSAGSHSGSSGVPQMSAPTPQITPQPLRARVQITSTSLA